MLYPLQNIAFKGIYDLIVPIGTPQERIDSKAAEIKKLSDINKGKSVKLFDVIQFKDRIRIVSVTDNPNVIMNLFETIGGENLALQYLKRNVQQYNLNLQV